MLHRVDRDGERASRAVLGATAKWLGWSLVLSVVPFAVQAFLYFTDEARHEVPHLWQIIGTGQALLTTISLMASGLKELHIREVPPAFTSGVTLAVVVALMFVGAYYGSTANEVLANQLSDEEREDVACVSAALLGGVVVLALLCVGAAANYKAKASKAKASK